MKRSGGMKSPSSPMTGRSPAAIFMLATAAILITILTMIITSAQASAIIDLVSPEDGMHTNQSTNTFEYYLNFNATQCTIKIDGTSANTTQSNNAGFNTISASAAMGEHQWKVSCAGSNGTEESEENQLTIDLVGPSIVLFTPQDGATLTTRKASLSFVALDNFAELLGCSINIDGEEAYTVEANNSEPMTMTTYDFPDGTHTWNVGCSDMAQNYRMSDTRSFKTNTTPAAPTFSISLSRTAFYTGEQGQITVAAPEGSSARVEVCPDTSGFVECSVPIDVHNSTSFPIQQGLPFLYNANKYIVEAYFTYANYTETKTARYNVSSNIAINVDYPDKPRKNEPVMLEANAGGGYGTLNYKWILSNGNVVENRKANITYASAGNYTNIIIVTDAYNNSVNRSISLDVSDSYKIKVIVKDEETQAKIWKATVEVDDQEKDTDTNGEVELFLRKGKRDISILAENYSLYAGELNVTNDETFTILLMPMQLVRTEPQVTLTYPDNNAKIMGDSSELGFKVDHKYKTNCSIYISEELNSGFFIHLGDKEVAANDNGEKRIQVIELENMTYYWKVECSDDKGKTGSSETRKFDVGLKTSLSKAGNEIQLLSSRVKEYELLLSDIANMPPDLKEGVTRLGLGKQIEDAIKVMKDAIRDIDGLSRSNQPADQIESSKRSLFEKAESAYQKAPVDITLLGSDSFVDYIESADLEGLVNEVIKLEYGENESINAKQAFSRIEELQQEAVISTKTKNLRVSFRDGAQKDITLVIRDIKTYNITSDATLVEAIPKEVAASAGEIKSAAAFKVIKDDPIISFPLSKDATITYYFEKHISPESLRDIRIAVFTGLDRLEPEYVTGFSISDFAIPGIKKGWLIPTIVIILAGLVVFATKYEGVKAAKYALYLAKRKNTVHYINVILSDIADNLQAGNVQKAISLYDEAKSAYIDLPSIAKNDVYEKIMDTANRIENYQETLAKDDRLKSITARLQRTEQMISTQQIGIVIHDYKQIEEMYHSLEDNEKDVVHARIVDIGNKIQVMIDSNKA